LIDIRTERRRDGRELRMDGSRMEEEEERGSYLVN